ncbi:hypothetical protein BD311DRAFT_245005 [Dichomitus squalens]|uniref:Uncharacterized protein n=1 Tax=Dichomitus squalens TaxID=114155 RepID=A0A4Q9M3C0_9APHY|nr:hypothetical protein BD311DRAFT_245005 [Dichomitus squalens]
MQRPTKQCPSTPLQNPSRTHSVSASASAFDPRSHLRQLYHRSRNGLHWVTGSNATPIARARPTASLGSCTRCSSRRSFALLVITRQDQDVRGMKSTTTLCGEDTPSR